MMMVDNGSFLILGQVPSVIWVWNKYNLITQNSGCNLVAISFSALIWFTLWAAMCSSQPALNVFSCICEKKFFVIFIVARGFSAYTYIPVQYRNVKAHPFFLRSGVLEVKDELHKCALIMQKRLISELDLYRQIEGLLFLQLPELENGEEGVQKIEETSGNNNWQPVTK